MSLFKISEKFVLNKLKNISQGNLKLINYDGKVFHFGDLESKLSSDIKINNPNFLPERRYGWKLSFRRSSYEKRFLFLKFNKFN